MHQRVAIDACRKDMFTYSLLCSSTPIDSTPYLTYMCTRWCRFVDCLFFSMYLMLTCRLSFFYLCIYHAHLLIVVFHRCTHMYMRTRWRWLLSPIHSNILQCHASAVLRTWQHLLSFRRLMRFIFTNIVDAAWRYKVWVSVNKHHIFTLFRNYRAIPMFAFVVDMEFSYLFSAPGREFIRHCEWNHSCIRQGMNQKVAHKTLSMLKLTTLTPSIFSLLKL